MNKALAEPASRDKFLQSATEPVGGTPEDLARSARADYDKYARLIAELNIRAG
jgi:tripartite-type tricarboxylate transporter receptor subunit TctC